jgi:hypothetical protein
MKIKIASAVAATFALLPLAAQSEGISYTYVEAAYVETDIDGISRNADGYALRGSIAITDTVFMFAGYADQGIGAFDFEAYNIGAGYAWPLTSRTDLYGKVSYVKAEASGFGFSGDDDGFGLGIGVRHLVTDQFELEAAVSYVDLSDSGDDTALGIGARWHFTPQFSVGAEASFADDAKSYGVGLRWSFGS